MQPSGGTRQRARNVQGSFPRFGNTCRRPLLRIRIRINEVVAVNAPTARRARTEKGNAGEGARTPDPAQPVDLTPAVGANLRRIRVTRGLSLERLAKASAGAAVDREGGAASARYGREPGGYQRLSRASGGGSPLPIGDRRFDPVRRRRAARVPQSGGQRSIDLPRDDLRRATRRLMAACRRSGAWPVRLTPVRYRGYAIVDGGFEDAAIDGRAQ